MQLRPLSHSHDSSCQNLSRRLCHVTWTALGRKVPCVLRKAHSWQCSRYPALHCCSRHGPCFDLFSTLPIVLDMKKRRTPEQQELKSLAGGKPHSSLLQQQTLKSRSSAHMPCACSAQSNISHVTPTSSAYRGSSVSSPCMSHESMLLKAGAGCNCFHISMCCIVSLYVNVCI